MRKIHLLLLPLLIASSYIIGAVQFFVNPVSALSGSQFNAERIMDDSVFFSSGELTASQIQTFLNSKVPVCDTNHAETSSPNDSGAPYTCLKDYRQNTPSRASESLLCNSMSAKSNQSAAQIIHDVSKACGVSTRVLLVLLQKEQSLVTDTWPWRIQYDRATGFSCPDTAPCDPSFGGFFYQVFYAARQFKYYKKINGPNYRVGYTNYVQYSPIASCGGKNLFLRSQATAGLYNYTPYQPNAAALNNLYGTGNSCSSYGNRNFWRMYNDWFGSTLTNIAYDTSLVSAGVYTNVARTNKYTQKIVSMAPGAKAYVKISVRNTGWKNWDKSFTRIGRHGNDTTPFMDSSWFMPNRPAQLVEDTVVPGDIGTFVFDIVAPATRNSYREDYQMLIEGKTWLNVKLNLTINVTNSISAQSTSYRLDSNDEVLAGKTLVSPDLQNTLVLQKDGNLILYNTFYAKWYTSTAHKNSKRLVMQSDGNLVLYDNGGKALWHSHTSGNPGSYFVMQTDGNMVVYSSSNVALWNSRTVENPNLLSYVSPTLYDRAYLHIGQQLETPDRKYKLVLQQDGNLVLYSKTTGNALWHSKTFGKPSHRLDMQHDGNLVLYDVNGKAIWNTRTATKGYSRLVIQQDGNLVIYDKASRATWSSHTRGQP